MGKGEGNGDVLEVGDRARILPPPHPVQAVALLVSNRRIIGIETKSSIERLSPCIGLAIVAEGKGV